MNKATNIIALFFIILLVLGCKKEQFEHGPIDFKYADNIAGTYIGIRTKDGPIYWTAPEGALNPIDTITVVVEDHRTDKVCSFYIDYFDNEFIVKPNGNFIDDYSSFGDPGASTGSTYRGYFKGDTLIYTNTTDFYKYNVTFNSVEFKLVKQ